MVNSMKVMLKIILMSSFMYTQHVSLYFDQVVYNNSDNVDIFINMESDAPIVSFNFTLNGFGNILLADSISTLCLSDIYLESLSFVDNYFSGGDTNSDPIPATNNGIFLTINADYDSSNLDGQFLTINEVSPGYNNLDTHFYTYDEDGNLVEMSYDWIPMTWELGTNNVIPWIGQDCAGDIWGTAFEDDCGECSEGTTGHAPNSDIDCNGDCFGIAELDDCNVCGGDNSTCLDDCGVPNGDNSTCLDDCGVPNGDNSTCEDCAGIPNGGTILDDWYPDCDIDNLADNTNFVEVCGYPDENIIISVCGFLPDCSDNIDILCGLIAIDPNNHSFDANPDCTSNSVDDCGECDGFNQHKDCNGQCYELTPICSDPSYSGYQGLVACENYIGLGSNHNFSHNSGIDDCGQCGGDNSTCTGCTDIHATNYNSGCDGDCLFYDGSCTFELYPGDVNRDGLVDINDVDGLGIFWHQQGSARDYQSIDWHMQYATDNWDNICAAYADTNGDGIVDHLDLSAILYNWGNQINYQYYEGPGLEGPALCYDLQEVGDYRQNFEEILAVLETQDYDDIIVRHMIEYILELLGINFQPEHFQVYQNFPNPFNPSTKINFDIEIDSNVKLSIYNLKGQLVHEHNFGYLNPGLYSYEFNASNLTSGNYIYNISTSNGMIDYRHMILIK